MVVTVMAVASASPSARALGKAHLGLSFSTEDVVVGGQCLQPSEATKEKLVRVGEWTSSIGKFIDPDGRNPLCAAGPMGCVVGAGVGAATGVGIYVLTTPSNERTAGGYALAAGLGMVGGGTMARGIKGAWDVGRAMMGFGAAANLGDAALAMGAAAAFVSGEGAAVNALRSAPRAGFTRFYRGTNVPTVTQVAPSARGKGGQAPAPFVPTEAEARAAAQNPQVQARSDVVSMTTDLVSLSTIMGPPLFTIMGPGKCPKQPCLEGACKWGPEAIRISLGQPVPAPPPTFSGGARAVLRPSTLGAAERLAQG